jgi:hypothetical protein
MAKSKFSVEEQNEIKRIMKHEGVTRKTAIRHLFGKKTAAAPAKDFKSAAANDKVESAPAPKSAAKTPAQPKALLTPKQVGAARAEGIRLFKLAGRPTKDQFIAVYGPKGAKMTWDQRAAAGVPAEKFQDALQMATTLAAKTSQRSTPVPSPAPTAGQASVTTEKKKAARRG